ncbi:unnamed protein product [Adineta steineri]|uniref:Serine/threonine-protein phosphatase n=2 Tax=Adineta steineri TaxID=433720 RepID=A0A814K7H2_9BILA|nr:unnamed protein product [Adineta steineri]CAF3642603.1 unnamed protein product [Adineta steineri]
MTRTNNSNIEHSPSHTSSSSSSAVAQPSSTEPKDIINQNELTIQKLLLELQDDLKQTKECYNSSRDAWLSIQQQQKSSTSPNENINSQSSKTNLTQALTNVQNEINMYKTALAKISQVRQLQIEIANVTKNHIDVSRSHTTRRGLADLLSHMAYVLKIWYGSEHSGNCSNKGDVPPPLCGAIPAASNHVCHVGDLIAGFVESDDGDENWILAEVANVHPNKTKYDIVDIDAEPDKGRYYNINKRHVIPLPQWRACPLTCPQALFVRRTIVLALYPQTSCFYKGIVESIPRIGKDSYSIIFEDSSYNSGYSPEFDVPQMFVVAYKDIVPQVAAISDRADKMKMVSKLSTMSIDKSASKIQSAFRKHQARLKLKKQAAWQIHEKLEYSSEQTESKLKDMFEKLIKASGTLSPSVTKLLHKAGLPVEEKELLKLTNPDNIRVETSYRGPRIDGPITRKVFVDLIEAFQRGQILHEKYVCEILHQARAILKTVPNFNHIDLANLQHVFIVGDLHGQLADLLHIFNTNGLPSTDNAYIFNGDFVDRGRNSVEVILLLMVALILYPSSVFLNRGNHEDIMVTVRYGFHNEVNQKYRTRKAPLIDLFKDIFSWLPLYSYVDAGKMKLIVMHGGISDKINLKKLNSLSRNRYVSIEVPPESKSGGKRLTEEEDNEYHQIQDLFWSDPDPRGRKGCRKNDDRKMACFFGSDVTHAFLKKYNLNMIIRSHQAKQDGYEYNHDGKVLTVFSASNYCGGNNWGAVVRWDYNEEEPWISSFKTEGVAMEKLSFSKQVTLFEDPAYHSLIEKIMSNKTLLLKEFLKADTSKTEHLSLTIWADIMSDVLQMDLPWLILRTKLVQEDPKGILYNTMFTDYILDNSKFQMANAGIMEDLYMWKDMLLALFNLIDYNHSGFISRNEFADIIKIILDDENGSGSVNDAYVEELTSAMDFDKNGKIDFNEFLESFRIVNVKKPIIPIKPSNAKDKPNGKLIEHKIRV